MRKNLYIASLTLFVITNAAHAAQTPGAEPQSWVWGVWQGVQDVATRATNAITNYFRPGPSAEEQKRIEADWAAYNTMREAKRLTEERKRKEAEEERLTEEKKRAEEQKAAQAAAEQAIAERKAEVEQLRLEQARLARDEKRLAEEKKQREAEIQRFNEIRAQQEQQARQAEVKRRTGETARRSTLEEETKQRMATLAAQGKPLKQVVEQDPQRTESLLIFLDNAEHDGLDGPIGIRSVMAFLQHAGPIVVSGSLLSSIFQQVRLGGQEQTYYQQVKKLLDEINQGNKESIIQQLNKISPTPHMSSIDLKALALQYFQDAFRPQEWLIKQINPQLFIFVPQWWLIQARDRAAQLQALPGGASPLTLATGLALDSMQTVTLGDGRPLQTSQDMRMYIDQFKNIYEKHNKYSGSEYFLNVLNYFITRDEYAALNKKLAQAEQPPVLPPAWAFYLAGHGGGDVKAGLKAPQFRAFLGFMATKVYTKIFIYHTCFATGTEAYQLYKEEESKKSILFNFPIIAESMPNAMASTPGPRIPIYFSREDIDTKNHSIVLYSDLNYRAFVDGMQQATDLDGYARVLPSVLMALKHFAGYVGSSPQIKLPGLEWFSFLDLHKKTFSIGKILAATRKKPLHVTRYLGKKYTPIEAILLYADHVPFDLVIDIPYFPMLLSMKGRRSAHIIDKIITRSRLGDITNSLERAGDAIQGSILIKTLISADGTFNNVLIYRDLGEEPDLYITAAGKYRNWHKGVWTDIERDYMKELGIKLSVGEREISTKAKVIATFFEFKPFYQAIETGNVALVKKFLDIVYPTIGEEIFERVEKARKKAGGDASKLERVAEVKQALNEYLDRVIRKPQETLDILFESMSDDKGAQLRLIRLVQKAETDAEALIKRDTLIKLQRNAPKQAVVLLKSMVEKTDAEDGRYYNSSTMSYAWKKEGRMKKPFKEMRARL